MSDFSAAIELIRKYEGYNEKAYPDPCTGAEPYTIGYGTQFYPDGSPVRRGQLCTKEKALEYLFHEVEIINTQLTKLNLGIDSHMRQALISFIHSIGWEPFLYSAIIDCIENEDFFAVPGEIGSWIFDENYQVIGNLLDRRREESRLFLTNFHAHPGIPTGVLLTAFQAYSGKPHEITAIQSLENQLNPYVLSEFANAFKVSDTDWTLYRDERLDFVFDN